MIELFELTLVNGGDLEAARQSLQNQANTERMNRNAAIEHDFRVAFLIRECLMTEPKGSSGYSVAKGIMNRLNEKYRDREIEKLCKKLRKADKERVNDDQSDRKEEQAQHTGKETFI